MPGGRAVTAEDTYPVRAAYGHVYHMTRAMVRGGLDSDLPGGLDTLFHTLSYSRLSVDDFLAACRHHGLDHLLFDIKDGEVDAELESRRARGAPPTDRELPFAVNGEEDRELADAMLDAYERRVADAEAMVRARAAARGGRAPRPPRGAEARALALGKEAMQTREGLRRLIGAIMPHGRAYLPYHLLTCGLGVMEFKGACRRFGLGHLVFDVTIREVLAELDARRARGAPPTDRELPLMMGEDDRAYADAMLDVYGRRAAEAEARAALEVAPAAA